jgi:hypothetical protein
LVVSYLWEWVCVSLLRRGSGTSVAAGSLGTGIAGSGGGSPIRGVSCLFICGAAEIATLTTPVVDLSVNRGKPLPRSGQWEKSVLRSGCPTVAPDDRHHGLHVALSGTMLFLGSLGCGRSAEPEKGEFQRYRRVRKVDAESRLSSETRSASCAPFHGVTRRYRESRRVRGDQTSSRGGTFRDGQHGRAGRARPTRARRN